jgi:hypothetical protein
MKQRSVDCFLKCNSVLMLQNISIKEMDNNQMLVGQMVIDAGLDREDHSSIPRNCDRD